MINHKQKIGDLLYRDKGLVIHVGVYLGCSLANLGERRLVLLSVGL